MVSTASVADAFHSILKPWSGVNVITTVWICIGFEKVNTTFSPIGTFRRPQIALTTVTGSGVTVGVGVGVSVATRVSVGVGVIVSVGMTVAVGVGLAVGVGVHVGVAVGVGVTADTSQKLLSNEV
jgi:hypothetical protein